MHHRSRVGQRHRIRTPWLVMSYRNAYLAIAILMSAAVLATGLAAWLGGWSHLTIWIEVVLIALFAAFWALQTVELWDRSLRQHAKPHA
jgi:hypothetical protein